MLSICKILLLVSSCALSLAASKSTLVEEPICHELDVPLESTIDAVETPTTQLNDQSTIPLTYEAAHKENDSNSKAQKNEAAQKENDSRSNVQKNVISESDEVLTPGIDCLRNCTADPNPKTCYYEFVVQQYEVQGIACDYCTPNATNYVNNDCQCVRADGYPRTMVAVNRMLPGPAIYVCKGDQVIVDVSNEDEGAETSIHWHGMAQRNTQYYDGVPHVTQCPIPSATKFRYIFNADEAGTYFWHSHSGLQKADGMAGSLVIYESQNEDPHGHLYDYDTWETVMLLQDWKHERFEQVFPGVATIPYGQEPDALLINGLGAYNDDGTLTLMNGSYAEFNVTQGYRYRFRLINALATVCPVSIQIHNHNMTVISTDQCNVDPFTVDTIISMTGERYDFIIEADQEIDAYWIEARGLGECEGLGIFQMAVLRYEGAENVTLTPPTVNETIATERVLNPVNYNYTEVTNVSYPITQLDNLELDYDIKNLEPNRIFYVSFGIHAILDEEQEAFYAVNNYEHYSINTIPSLAIVSNITFEAPRSPLLSQFDDVDTSKLCNLTTCVNDAYCSCTNMIELELNEVVDLFIVDTGYVDDLYHPIHLHGLKMYVLDIGYASDLDLDFISAEAVRTAHERGDLADRFIYKTNLPVAKDTVAVPTNGYAHIRLVADNPGFWFMHCHIDVHMEVGMAMVFRVGDFSDLPDVPTGFPTCGDFKA